MPLPCPHTHAYACQTVQPTRPSQRRARSDHRGLSAPRVKHLLPPRGSETHLSECQNLKTKLQRYLSSHIWEGLQRPLAGTHASAGACVLRAFGYFLPLCARSCSNTHCVLCFRSCFGGVVLVAGSPTRTFSLLSLGALNFAFGNRRTQYREGLASARPRVLRLCPSLHASKCLGALGCHGFPTWPAYGFLI